LWLHKISDNHNPESRSEGQLSQTADEHLRTGNHKNHQSQEYLNVLSQAFIFYVRFCMAIHHNAVCKIALHCRTLQNWFATLSGGKNF